MRLLGRRAPREGVQIRQMYPEPWFITNRWWAWMLYRGLLGRPMDGVRWTNSTFWRAASEGEDHWWLRLAGWQRSMLRLAMLWSMLMLTALTVMWGLFGATELVLQLLLLHLVGAAPVLLLLERRFQKEHGLRLPLRVEELEQLTPEQEQELDRSGADVPVSRQWRMVWVREGRRTWREEVLEPVAAAAAAVLDVAWRPGEAERWVDVPRQYMLPGHPVEIMLPKSWSASEAKKKALLQAVKPRLGMLEVTEQWLLQGKHPKLLLSAPPAPPAIAHYATYREQLLQMTEQYRPVLGVVSSGELLQAEMVDDSPHIAVSAGSGAGKSVLLRTIVAQVLHWGWSVIMLDWKAESHEWAKGLPGVTYVTEIEALHDALVRIGEEVEIRKALPKEERLRRPRVLVVCEEWNMTSALLADYWSALRGTAEPDEKRTMPTRSPALTGMQTLEFAGRSFGMFAALIAQRMSNRVFNGNVDRRENYMIRMLARYTTQTWKMLLPHLKYMKKPTALGRWVVAAGEEATYMQAILMSEEEARELATSGVAPAGSPFALGQQSEPVSAEQVEARTQGDQLRPVVTSPNGDNPELDYRPAPVILKKLSDISVTLEYLGITEGILRKAARSDAQGDPSFPVARGGMPNTGYLYDLGEVTEWARRKRATEQAEKERRG
jgi:hypothetical protein